MIFPCRIDWDSMTDQGTGKFCAECQRAVSDYTRDSPQHQQSEWFCGRFDASQLDFHRSEYEIKNFRRLSISVFALLGTVFSNERGAMAQAPESGQVAGAGTVQSFRTSFSELRFPLKLEGELRDKTSGELIRGADVRVLQKDLVTHSVKTDDAGRFAVILQKQDVKDTVFDLRVSYVQAENSTISDSLIRIPVTADTVRSNAVFKVELMLHPFPELQMLAIRPPALQYYTGGVSVYTWSPPVLKNAEGPDSNRIFFPHAAGYVMGTCTISPVDAQPAARTLTAVKAKDSTNAAWVEDPVDTKPASLLKKKNESILIGPQSDFIPGLTALITSLLAGLLFYVKRKKS